MVSVTDCKSLFDSVHRAGGPRAPAEKRLLVDLAALRQMVQQETNSWSPNERATFDKALKWIPTTHEGRLVGPLEEFNGSRINSTERECQ